MVLHDFGEGLLMSAAAVTNADFECLIMKRYNCGSKIVRSFFVKYSPFNGFKYTAFSRITCIINELLLFLVTPFWLYYVGEGIYEIYENWANTNFNDSTGCPICVNVSLLRKRTTPSFCCIRYQEYFVSQWKLKVASICIQLIKVFRNELIVAHDFSCFRTRSNYNLDANAYQTVIST